MTFRALKALEECQVVVGYRTYLNLIADLLEGKEVISSGMRREQDRARQAVSRALEGKIVAVVSGGDAGIYGMAGLILEEASSRVTVEILPGVTAASAAAATLGAPLIHDFAVISLSDLLTPWEKISRRLEASAQGDFVIVIYNPRSNERPHHLESARQILLKHKNPDTPVGIVRQAGRENESIRITNLKDIPVEEVDMLTVIVVGNSESMVVDGKIITPRGYEK